MRELPQVPWQITGNHWVTLPCIHPADASIHSISVVHARSRGSIEFAGGPDYLDGAAPALFRLSIDQGNGPEPIGREGIAWERDSGWIPAFTAKAGTLAIRGVICAPHGRNADVAGVVVDVSIENRGAADADVTIFARGSFGCRLLRVRTPRVLHDDHAAAIAIGSDDDAPHVSDEAGSYEQSRRVNIPAGESRSVSWFIAAGQERDGADAVLGVMRRRGAANLVSSTRTAVRAMEPATGNAAADRLIARHMFFAYFCGVARAIDDAHLYVMRSRIPWNAQGVTIRDWEALMWIMPAVQLADAALSRELLLRICDLHGYAPGAGVHYLDGSLFEPGFSLEGAAAFPIAVDEYIVHSGDDRIVEEPLLADSLYNASEDIESRKHKTLPLYSTEVNPDGSVPEFAFTAHGNSVVALALEILSKTLDEKTAEKVQDSAAVRAAILRQFADVDETGKGVLTRSVSLHDDEKSPSGASASMYWLPYYDLLGRDDSVYRRTVKPLDAVETDALFLWCARLLGPSGSRAIDWLRRAPLDGGFAAEIVDGDGRATGNGGDAALSGLVASTVWYGVNALGLAI